MTKNMNELNQNTKNFDSLMQANKNLSKNSFSVKRRSERIVELLMKIKTCQDTSSILTKIFGSNLIDKIISQDLDENILNEIEKTVSEIESYKIANGITTNKEEIEFNQKNQENPNQNQYQNNYNDNNREYRFENEDELSELSEYPNLNRKNNNVNYTPDIGPMKKIENYNTLQKRQLNQSSMGKANLETYLVEKNNSTQNNNTNPSNRGMRRSNSRSTLNASRNSKSRSKSKLDFFEENMNTDAKFEGMLRKYGGMKIDGKVFMNYSKNKGDFFDPTLQKGGNSTLDYKDKQRKRSNSRKRGINNSVSISYSNV